jgi:hypothetical protein
MSNSITACEIFGCPNQVATGQEIISGTSNLVEWGTNLVFPFIILIGIFVIVNSAFKIVRSQGNTEQIEKAKKGFRGVFVGIAILIVGLIGYFLVISFFGASNVDLSVDKPDALQNIDLPFI